MRSDFQTLQEALHVGSQTTCQLGNPSDTYGYRENVPVTVVGERSSFGQKFFLVKIDGEDYLAQASVYPHCETEGVLYSTMARHYGPQCRLGTEDQAKRELGF